MGEFCVLAQAAEKYAKEIRLERDAKYGGFKVSDLGIKGLFVDVFRKHGRLKSLVWDGYGESDDDAVLDTAIDLANYALAIAGVILLKKTESEKEKNV
jgi:hypothetical protein